MRLKLVSRKDTLLGHVDVPDFWGEYLRKSGAVSAYLTTRLGAALLRDNQVYTQTVDAQTVTLAYAYFSQHRAAVYLAQGTIEQLEQMLECSFTPSMAFLRSHLTRDE